jgi:hypothetical protein
LHSSSIATIALRAEPGPAKARRGYSPVHRLRKQISSQNSPDETILGNSRNHPETEREYVLANRGGKVRLEAQMNHSIHSADRSTHLKIVVVALVAGIAVAAFGISARTNADYSQTAHVVKAGKPVVVTSSDISKVQ